MTWVIVVAAGSGDRFGGPKQYEAVAGRRVLDWSLAAAVSAAGPSGGVVAVVPPDRASVAEAGADVVVAGGATRSGSVRAGLAAVPDDADVIVVHDAARPAARAALFRAVIAAVVAGADAAIPGVPLVDTVKRVGADRVVIETPDRGSLVAVQTPQAFSAPVLRAAHLGSPEATDDAALVESAGGHVVVVPGDNDNIKITELADLDRLEKVLAP